MQTHTSMHTNELLIRTAEWTGLSKEVVMVVGVNTDKDSFIS